MSAKRKSAAPSQKSQSPAPGRRKVDWDAVERDYRTGKFTDSELSAKHKVTREAISRKRKRDQADRPSSWAQDLGPQVRAATNALLLKEAVASQITDDHKKVTDVILVTAEINNQVIAGHRRDLSEARTVAASLLKELADAALAAEEKELLASILAGEGAEPADEARIRGVVNKALSVNSRVSSIKALAEAFVKIQDAERKAYRIDDEPQTPPPNPVADLLAELSSRGSRLPVKGDGQ
jgi:hypothetical protein